MQDRYHKESPRWYLRAYLSTEQLERFFARELVERGGYGRAVAEAHVIGAAAEHGVLSPEGAERN